MILGRNASEEPMKDYIRGYMKYAREVALPETLNGLRRAGFKIPEVDLDEQCASFKCPPDILHDFIHYGDNIETLVKHVRSVDPDASEERIREKPIGFVNRHFYAPGKPAYVTRVGDFDMEDAMELTDAMNCKLFIAHPGGEYGFLSDKTLDYFIEQGIHGIEVRNYFNTPEQNAKFDRIAKERGLIRSGGSDCHGNNGPFKIGCYDRPHNQLPSEVLEELWYGLPGIL